MNPNQCEQLLDALAEAIGNALYSLPEESPACDVSRVLLEGALAAYQQARMPGAILSPDVSNKMNAAA